MKLRIAPIALALLAFVVLPLQAQNKGETLDVSSGGKSYVSYLSAPQTTGRKPAVVLVHSFNGMEQGYKDMVDRFAADGFVVLAVGWQTFERGPSDAVVETLLKDAVVLLRARSDVDQGKIGLTGFCAGGRYTMLLLPTMKDFSSGVAWYGFPNNGGTATQPVKPIDQVGLLDRPILILHGSADTPSPIAGIYQYATALDKAGKYYEMKVYQGQPHGFMIQGGQLARSDVAEDAYQQMVAFFRRTLR